MHQHSLSSVALITCKFLHATMLSYTWLNVTLFFRGVSNDSSRTARKRRPRNQPCGKVNQDTK